MLVLQDSTDRSELKVIRVDVPSNGVCDNLVGAVNILANKQLKGDSLVQGLVGCPQDHVRFKKMDELRIFITVDKQEAMKFDDLEKDSVVLFVVELKTL